jgi:aldehyde:ferredoxin oxidoreductase
MPAGGYFGRALVVDVASGTSRSQPLPDDVLRGYIGGSGLGTWLLYQLGTPGADPLGPGAPLAFVFSPLVGTPLTTSAKFAVVAKSPLTGMLTDALASSQFAIAGKLTGHDAIVIDGRAPELSVLLVDGDGIRLISAAHLTGLTAAGTDRQLRGELGRGWRVAAIGPAGERGVRYATISHDGRHAGRGGLGTVMGAKNLKAIAVRAAAKVATADPAAVLAAARDLRERSFGPATAKYRELGTLANLLAFNAISALPSRNFQSATFDGTAELAGPMAGEAAGDIDGMRRVARSSCASCTIGCEHIYRVGQGRKVRAEYENVFALGPMCGVSEPGAVLAASARCDDLGIDTISAGGTIAWAMECAQRGLIDAPWLRFGDADALLRALDEIGARSTPLGSLLAGGSRRASVTVGGGSGAFAPHVKGLEMPGYEPRTLHAMALGLAVNARAVRPGHPVVLGVVERTPVLGAPGYPVSAALTFDIFAAPLLAELSGAPPRQRPRVAARLARKLASPLGTDDWVRVRLGSVGGSLVATPLPRGAGVLTSLVRADGLLVVPTGVEGHHAGSSVSVELLRGPDEIARTIVAIGSHDLVLDLASSALRADDPLVTLASSNVGSLGGLVALRDGLCHVAGSHLLDPETGEYTLPYVDRVFGAASPDVAVVRLVERSQGLIVAAGNPLGIEGLADVGRPGVRYVNRQRGAGTRVLLDVMLGQLSIAPSSIGGYAREEPTHLAVAAAIASGRVDTGMGIMAAARAFGLDFVPLAVEPYDLVVAPGALESPQLAPLWSLLQSDRFKASVEELGGYSTKDMGRRLRLG